MGKNNRIWELDALRGFAIICVILIHFLYDLRTFAGLSVGSGPVLSVVQQYGGVVFVLLSGLCATLGSRSFRRGLTVFACGMLVTAVTAGMVWLGMAHSSVLIRFGVLHLLGVCMMLWPLLRRLPVWAMAVLGVGFVALGWWFSTFTVESSFLFPFGLIPKGFSSGDFFPVFPHLGWFLLGAVVGKTVYRDKRSRFPRISGRALPLRVLCFCGRHSLWIYLLHQPVLFGLTMLL